LPAITVLQLIPDTWATTAATGRFGHRTDEEPPLLLVEVGVHEREQLL